MIAKKLQVVFFILPVLFLCAAGHCQSKPESGSDITVSGRLYVERRGNDEWLVLHGTDGKAYRVTGALAESLTAIALQKQDAHIVELAGLIDHDRTARDCTSRNEPARNDAGEEVINRTSVCIRYYHFEPRTIVSCVDSKETLPALERDTVAETKIKSSSPLGNLKPAIIGEIYGTIKQVNLRSPLKTVEIKNADKKSKVKSITVIITAKTRIAGAAAGKAPAFLLPENLKAGQSVIVTYDRNDIRAEALSISVTK